MSCRVLAVGEIVWDIIRDEEHIGGAPFNLAAHVVRLGGAASLLTRIGSDVRGRRAMRVMRSIGLDTRFVQRDRRRATGWAKADVGRDGSPVFTLPQGPAYHYITLNQATLRRLQAARFDAIAFGTWQQAGPVTRRTLREVLRRVRARIVLFDVNIRMDFYPRETLRHSLECSTIVKLNEEEVPKVARRLYDVALAESRLAGRLMRDFPVEVLCVTKGSKGCTVHVAGKSRNLPTAAVKVADTVGAGDAFGAAFLSHYCETGDPFEAARRGNLLGAYVASRPGAVPEYSAQIRSALAV